MSIGVALYNTDNLSSQQAFTLVEQFFQLLSLPITDAAYRSDNMAYTNVSPAELAQLVAAKKVTDFRVYHKDNEHLPWVVSFGYVTESSGGFNHIDIQYVDDIDTNSLKAFLKQAAEISQVAYGIVYHKDNVVDAYEYVLDEGVVPVPSYEKPLVWRDETPGMFNGPARYKDNMLRMVYPFNIINIKHLHIELQGKTLQEWISGNTAYGQLTPLTSQLFLWEVPASQLDSVNKICGEAGILIAWQA